MRLKHEGLRGLRIKAWRNENEYAFAGEIGHPTDEFTNVDVGDADVLFAEGDGALGGLMGHFFAHRALYWIEVRTLHRFVDCDVEGVLVVLVFDAITVLVVDVGACVSVEAIWATHRLDIRDGSSEALAVVGDQAVFVAKDGEDRCRVAGAKSFVQNSGSGVLERSKVVWRHVQIVKEEDDETRWWRSC